MSSSIYIRIINLTRGNLSLEGDEGKPSLQVNSTRNVVNYVDIQLLEAKGNVLLCNTLSSWITSGRVEVTRDGTIITADQMNTLLLELTNISENDEIWVIDPVNGNDTTGNGSRTQPFKSFRCLNSIPDMVENEINIKPKAGTYNYFPQLFARQYIGSGRIIIDASGEVFPVSAGPFTVQSTADVGATYGGYAHAIDITVTGSPGWTNDQYYGKYIHVLTGNWAGRVLPIFTNGSNTIRTTPDWYTWAGGDTFNIVDCPVVIDVDHTINIEGLNSLPTFQTSSTGSVPDAPFTPFFVTCGVKFDARNGSDDKSSRAITLSGLQGFFSFTTFQNKSTGRVLDCIDCINNSNQIQSGTLDEDLLGDYWYVVTNIVSDSGTAPTAFGYDIDLENTNFGQFNCRRAVHVHSRAENAFSYIMCGGILATTQSKFSTEYLFIQPKGFSANAFDLYGTNAFIYSAYIVDADIAIRARKGTQSEVHWLQGSGITDNYAVHLNYQSRVNNVGGAAVNIVGVTGAIKFLWAGAATPTHATWPGAATVYDDGAGSYVMSD